MRSNRLSLPEGGREREGSWRGRWEAGGGRSRFPPSGWLVVRDVPSDLSPPALNCLIIQPLT